MRFFHLALPEMRQTCRAGLPRVAAFASCGVVKMGARYVSTGTDLGFLLRGATQRASAVHTLNV